MSKQVKKPGRKKSPKAEFSQRAFPGGRPGTKSSIILQLLNKSDGSTLASLSEATGWQGDSVRGFLSAAKKKHGLDIASQLINGIRHYRVRGGKQG